VPSAPIKHTVKPGDTLIAIAKTYDTTVKDIADANSLDPGGLLRIGQELLIPIAGPSGGPGPTATPDGGALMYVVQPGDTVSTIAERFGSQMSWIFAPTSRGCVTHRASLLVPLTASTPACAPEHPPPCRQSGRSPRRPPGLQ
jgi:murein DD-endopeptidase MepM/ murein hydrolase activator NlpD